MLFNSYEFLLLFLPFALFGFYLTRHHYGNIKARAFLVVISLCFYGYWSLSFLGILIVSMLFNYYIGILLGRQVTHPKLILFFGISVDLALLGYFKYTKFVLDNANLLFSTDWQIWPIVLPLGISFFTFQQISYRMECYLGHRRDDSFLDYCTCVTFFPHLIAGPIVRYEELMPQFESNNRGLKRKFGDNFSPGFALFAIGLFKKVIIADSLAEYVSPLFLAATQSVPGGDESWGAGLGYTLQLYFDFSGYCDMAIGLAYMFGITFPANFDSPYKATSIIDFWRRWHITLSRFLRDYVYVPLGGNRKGQLYRYRNLMITMVLGGIWHGAGWTFFIWGTIHGLLLVLNHVWRQLTKNWRTRLEHSVAYVGISRGLTFILVVLAWVPFRAVDFSTALNIWEGMFSLPFELVMKFDQRIALFSWIGVTLVMAWTLPNSMQIFSKHLNFIDTVPQESWFVFYWRQNRAWACYIGILFLLSFVSLSKVSEFLYFQF